MHAVRTLLAEETRVGMLVGVAVGCELAPRAAWTTRRTERHMDIRFLGHAAFALGTTATDRAHRPVPDRQPEGGGRGRRARRRRDPAHARPRRPHRRHRRRSPSAPAPRWCAIVELAGEIAGDGVENVRDPNIGGTVEFDWGWVKLVPAWHTSTTPKGTVNTPAGPGHRLRRQADLPPRRHGACSATCSWSRAAATGRRRADVPIGGHYTMDRYDAVDGGRVRRAPRTVIPCHYDTFPPIETDAAGVQGRRRDAPARRGRRSSRRARPTRVTHAIVLIEAERDGDADAGRRARGRRGRRRGLLGDRRVGLRRDRARAATTRSSPRWSPAGSASSRASSARRRWSRSRSSPATTSRRCSRSANRARARGRRGALEPRWPRADEPVAAGDGGPAPPTSATARPIQRGRPTAHTRGSGHALPAPSRVRAPPPHARDRWQRPAATTATSDPPAETSRAARVRSAVGHQARHRSPRQRAASRRRGAGLPRLTACARRPQLRTVARHGGRAARIGRASRRPRHAS